MTQLNRHHQAFEPSPEVKAFIFQQIQELEPMLESIGSLGVYIEKSETLPEAGPSSEKFAIRLVVAPEGQRVEVRGESTNIFEACMEAKRLLIHKVSPFINATRASAERESLIKFYSGGGNIH